VKEKEMKARSKSKLENIVLTKNHFARFRNITFILFYINKNKGGRVLQNDIRRINNKNNFIGHNF
jgi:hypothetical protein